MSAVAHIDEYKTGRFYADEFRGASSWNGYENKVLLRNDGSDAEGLPHFTDVAMALGADEDGDGRGVAAADFDNDGDLDLAVNHNPGDSGHFERSAAVLLRNDVGQARHFLAVELRGTRSNRDGVGALVTLEAGGASQLRVVEAGSSYASQQSLRLYFGLNDVTSVDRLQVRWPSGQRQSFGPLVADQLVVIEEGGALSVRSLAGTRPGGARLAPSGKR